MDPTDLHETRKALVHHFAEAQELLQRSLSDTDLDQYLTDFPGDIGADDALALDAVRCFYGLVLRKIGFHICAVLRSNEQNNVPSLGVHARVIVECAAELVPMLRILGEDGPKEFARLLNNQEYDGNYWLLRLSKGEISREELAAGVTRAREGIGLFDGRQPTRVSVSDRVSLLTEGNWWYAYLSDCFCHTTPDKFRKVPGLGGVVPAPEYQFDLVFVKVMNCALTYICQALIAYGSIIASAGDGNRCANDAVALFERTRETAAPLREIYKRLVSEGPRDRSTAGEEQS